jgi:hypothetical protein
MPINFPSSPTLNQTYAFGQKTWVWNGYAWDLQLANANSVIAISQASYNQANAAFIHANSAFNTANNALDTWVRGQANAAFIQANAAFLQANTPSHVANSAAIYANGAFAAANAATATDATQNNSITAAFIRANNSLNANVGGNITGEVVVVGNLTATTFVTTGSNGTISGANAIFSNYVFAANGTVDLLIYANNAYTTANAAFAAANAAFIQANTPSHVANSAAIYANGAFAAANAATATDVTQNNSITAAFAHANAAFEQANTGGGGGTVTVSTFNATANGAQTTFAIGFSPVSADAVQVTLDGLIQPETSYTANANANTITFVTAPGNGEQVRVLSFYTGASAFVINDGSITPIKLSAETNNYINSIATAAATTEALSMAAALAIALG